MGCYQLCHTGIQLSRWESALENIRKDEGFGRCGCLPTEEIEGYLQRFEIAIVGIIDKRQPFQSL